MGTVDLTPRLSRSAFERLDVEGDDKKEAERLRNELGELLAERMKNEFGWAGVDAVFEALATLGHSFELRKSSDESRSYHQETNAGDRDFWIHASREDDLDMVMVLYHEKLEVTAARRAGQLSGQERDEALMVEAFYVEGLALVRRQEAGEPLAEDERLHVVLLTLESGVANGGFATYLSNTEGKDLADAILFLRLVGARRLEGVVERVAALVPSALDDGARQAALDTGSVALGRLDARFGNSKDNLALLAMRYLRRARSGEKPARAPKRKR
jgi:hypothetical protein